MIADWTVDLGPESPSIDVPWDGWIDLRSHAPAALEECQAYPELRTVLEALVEAGILSSKCDVFPVDREDVDPEVSEVAGEAATGVGLGSYLDLAFYLPSFDEYEALARSIAAVLNHAASDANSPRMQESSAIPHAQLQPDRPAAAEIVIRPSTLFGDAAYGLTLYAMGFGADDAQARGTWAHALRVVCSVTMNQITQRPSALLDQQPGE